MFLSCAPIHAYINTLNAKINIKYNPDTDMLQIFSSGSWKDWMKAGFKNLIIFDGTVKVPLSYNGFALSGALIEIDTKSKATYYCHTTSPVDVTGYSTLSITIDKYEQNSGASLPLIMGVSKSAPETNDDSLFAAKHTVTKSGSVNIGVPIDIDISALSGQYYVGIVNYVTYSQSGYSRISISRIELK